MFETSGIHFVDLAPWSGRAAVEWARRLGQSPGFDPAIGHLGTVATTLDRRHGRLS